MQINGPDANERERRRLKQENVCLRDLLEEVDAELDRQVYSSDAVCSTARAMRNNDMDLPPDFEHCVIVTEALWDRIRKAIA
jgi:hypothetical protein